MTTGAVRTKAALGRANRRKGIQTERDLARYLRAWWPDADRKPDTGYRTPERTYDDRGDIRGTPGVAWQAKYHHRPLSDAEVRAAMTEAEQQAIAAAADYGVTVERRHGKANPADWWAWLPAGDFAALVAAGQPGSHSSITGILARDPAAVPVRLRLGDLLPLFTEAGYGEPGVDRT